MILKKGVTRQMVEERLKEVFMDSLTLGVRSHEILIKKIKWD